MHKYFVRFEVKYSKSKIEQYSRILNVQEEFERISAVQRKLSECADWDEEQVFVLAMNKL